MANTASIFLVREAEFLAHRVRACDERVSIGWFRNKTYRRAAPATPDAPDSLPLLSWITLELAYGSSGESNVAYYLLDHAPGMHWVSYFRPDWALEL